MNRTPCDGLVVHAADLVVGLDAGSPLAGAGLHFERYEDGAVAWQNGLVVEAGPTEELLEEWAPRATYDASGCAVTAGLVDAHTHLVHAGDRSGEFAERLSGASYEALASKGGGILTTVRATRAASRDELLRLGIERARRMLASGTTTAEVKSGYDLTLDGELRLLEIAAEIGGATPLEVVPTLLTAHALPPEYTGRRDAYLEEVSRAAAVEAKRRGLAVFEDVFVDPRVGFTAEEARTRAAHATSLGLGLRLHVDQLADDGGAVLAAELGATSADHLDHARAEGVTALARAGTVAVLLPGASLTLGSPEPPIAELRRHGVPIAVASDANPGTSTTESLVLCLALACRLYGLTPDEVLAGATEHAARSLGRTGRLGCLRPGAAADLVIWDVRHAGILPYHFGPAWAREVFKRGVPVVSPARPFPASVEA